MAAVSLRWGVGLALSLTMLHGAEAGPAPGATVALDFCAGRYRVGAPTGYTPNFANLPGLTVSRAHTGFDVAYAETTDGRLIPFAANVARITDKGLLVEEARTNLAQQSQTFDNAGWTKTAVTVTADQAVAPDGTMTADAIVANGDSSGHFVSGGNSSTTNAVTYALSVYAKAGSARFLQLGGQSTTFGIAVWANFDLVDGTVGAAGSSTTASIQSLGNGWYRCIIVGAANATATGGLYFGPANASNMARTATFVSSQSVYAWGAQVEAGAFPTSYIPTTTASATRAADSIRIGGLNIAATYSIKAVQGSIPAGTGWGGDNPRLFELNDGTSNNALIMYRALTGTPPARLSIQGVNGGAVSTIAPSVGSYNRITAAAYYDGANIAAAADGSATFVGPQTLPSTLNTLWLGNRPAMDRPSNAYIERVVIKPGVENLTTWTAA